MSKLKLPFLPSGFPYKDYQYIVPLHCSVITLHCHPTLLLHPRDVVIHPDYYSPGVFNDVALLLLTALADTSQPHIGGKGNTYWLPKWPGGTLLQ